jgi:hypothetical protein
MNTSASERTRQLRLLRGLSSNGEKVGSYKTGYNPGLTVAALPKYFNKLDRGTRRANENKNGPIWLQSIGTGNNEVFIGGTAIDPNDGTVVVCGQTNEVLFDGPVGQTFTAPKAFIARYTSFGTFIAGCYFGSGDNEVSSDCIAIDPESNIYIGGYTRENLDNRNSYAGQNAMVLKFTPGLSLMWKNELEGRGVYMSYITVMMYSPDGLLYVGLQTNDENVISPEDGMLEHFAAVTVTIEPVNGDGLTGVMYGNPYTGGTFITSFAYLPTGSYGAPNPIIVTGGFSSSDAGAVAVPDAGDGGYYGYVVLSSPDLVDQYYVAGFGSGLSGHTTQILTLTTVPAPCSTDFTYFLFAGGVTNEANMEVLPEGCFQGFVTILTSGSFPGSDFSFVYPTLIGSSNNSTAVTAMSSNDTKFYVCGVTTENLGPIKTNGHLTGFALDITTGEGYASLMQIGTQDTLVYSIASDVTGNFYLGGYQDSNMTASGFVAKIAAAPVRNTPIFIWWNPDYANTSSGHFDLLTYSPGGTVTIDWGDGDSSRFTSGYEEDINHEYAVVNRLYLVTIDITGGTLGALDASNAGIFKLDVSQCPNLGILRCHNNIISNLDVSRCTNLDVLRCDGNQLTSLNLSTCSVIDALQFQGGNNAISIIHYEKCGLSNFSTTHLEDSINELSNDNIHPGFIYLDSNQEISLFEGDAEEYFSASLPDWTFIIVPVPPVLGYPNISPDAPVTGTGTLTVNQTGGTSFQWRFLDIPSNPSSANLPEGVSSINGAVTYNFTCTGTQTDTLTIVYSSTPARSVSIACVVTNSKGSVTTSPIIVSNGI